MKRKDFLRITTPAFLLLANGQFVSANNLFKGVAPGKKQLRFVVASDGHYGQKGTSYETYFATLVRKINEEHQKEPYDFAMINGDIIHDDPKHFAGAKAALDKLNMKYSVTQGNHDHASPQLWESVWKMPLNYDFVIKGNAFLAASTSNEKGEYLSPDVKWFSQKLEQHKRKKNVLIFVHINQAKLTTHGIMSPDFLNLVSRYKNVRCIFNGHDHNEDGIKTWQNLRFVFDTHFGGNWGTAYRGYRVVELMEDNSLLSYVRNPFKVISKF